MSKQRCVNVVNRLSCRQHSIVLTSLYFVDVRLNQSPTALMCTHWVRVILHPLGEGDLYHSWCVKKTVCDTNLKQTDVNELWVFGTDFN